MLTFAEEYSEAINALTGNRDMKIRAQELDDTEWAIVKDLCASLKVCVPFLIILRCLTLI